MSMMIRILIWTMLPMWTLSAGATDLPSSDKSIFKIIRHRAIGADVLEIEASRDSTVAQEIRRHYQTKSYTSEYMLSLVKCSNREINIVAYRWYAEAGLGGALVYSSDRETGWYAADKDPAAQALVTKVCV